MAEECLDIDDVFKPSWAVFLIVPCVDQYPREIVKITGSESVDLDGAEILHLNFF